MNSPPDTVKCVETHYFKDDGNPFQRVSRKQAGNSLLAEAFVNCPVRGHFHG